MRNTISLLGSLLLLAACSSESAPQWEGTYTTGYANEYNTTQDTVDIVKKPGARNVYTITKHSTTTWFKDDGTLGHSRNDADSWDATYDSKTGMLTNSFYKPVSLVKDSLYLGKRTFSRTR